MGAALTDLSTRHSRARDKRDPGLFLSLHVDERPRANTDFRKSLILSNIARTEPGKLSHPLRT